jgi:hypothetical protein
MQEHYPWYEVFKMAILELDRSRLQTRILCAQHVISEREKELADDHGGTAEERQAISDALSSLKVLQCEVEHTERVA